MLLWQNPAQHRGCSFARTAHGARLFQPWFVLCVRVDESHHPTEVVAAATEEAQQRQSTEAIWTMAISTLYSQPSGILTRLRRGRGQQIRHGFGGPKFPEYPMTGRQQQWTVSVRTMWHAVMSTIHSSPSWQPDNYLGPTCSSLSCQLSVQLQPCQSNRMKTGEAGQ